MTQFLQHPLHTFFWVDLGVPDVDVVRTFYTNLLGWQEEAVQIEQWTYITFTVDNKAVAALYAMAPGQLALGYPVAWMPYLRVADVDALTAQVQQLGGKVLRGPFDVGDQGRTSAIQDPTGATLYLWQPDQLQGAQLLNQPGALSWVELATPASAQAEAFYGQLLGWEATAQMIGDERYVTFHNQGQPVAGLFEQPDQPARWRVYFGVHDCQATAQRVGELGGAVLVPPTLIPTRGRFAVLRDPQGVGFAIVEQPTGV